MGDNLAGVVNRESLEKQALDMNLRAEASKRAGADPLPGPLSVAFGPSSISVRDPITGQVYNVRQVVAYDWAILKLLKSPVYLQMLEVMQEGDKAKEVESQDHETWELIFLLTRPCKESKKLFDKGENVFRDAAAETIGMEANLGLIANLNLACWNQIKSHMETMVKYAPVEKQEADVEQPNFSASEKKFQATG